MLHFFSGAACDILVSGAFLGEWMNLTTRWESTENGNKYDRDPQNTLGGLKKGKGNQGHPNAPF